MASDGEIFKMLFIKLLVKCPVDRLEMLFHYCIDVFCGRENTAYENYSDVWTFLEWWDLINSSKDFLKRLYNSDTDVSDFLSSLPLNFQNIIKDCLNVRAEDLKNSLLEKSHAISPAYLKNFDWAVKLTVASDKVAQLNQPRLMLDLDISGNTEKVLHLDLSKEEVKLLIDSMEKAKIEMKNFLIDE